MEVRKFPRLAYNWISAVGVAMALVSGVTLAVLLAMVLATGGEGTNPYYGIFMYMVLPPILILGIVLIPIGMVREWRHWKKTGEKIGRKWPAIDLNKPSHRNAIVVFVFATIFFFVLSGVGSYSAYQYSESVEFCGTTCHTPMTPEYTTYQRSPHARVACATCHIGPGAGWFVKSKLSGSYQMYAVLTNKFPRPIATPIESLRPAQVTCEQCHWPKMIFGAQQRQFNHYKYDEGNTYWPIDMLIKTGGGDPRTGQTAGIHWHMNIGVKVEYIARDEKREEIPWVRVEDTRTGRVTIYQSKEKPLTPEELAAATPRVMDCMDCHNRPSHIFHSPDYAIDHEILTGKIDTSLPYIKQKAVEAMAGDYESKDQALRKIASAITDYYRTEHPEIAEKDSVTIENAVVATQDAFSHNIFPSMKARWSDYPSNIGHFISPGCFRCHDGEHVSEDGVVVSRDCKTCHTILSQGSGDEAEVASTAEGLEFKHPEDIAEMWRDTACYECHEGTQP